MMDNVHDSAPDTENSTAGSVQSHLSTTNSKQRLRLATASGAQNTPSRDQTPLALQHREQSSASGFALLLRHTLFPAPVLALPHPPGGRLIHLRPWSTLCLKWTVFTYCMLSLGIFSVTIYTHSSGDLYRSPLASFEYSNNSTLSAFEGISTAQRLSRISSLQPPFVAFEPYLIHPSEELGDPTAITACIWSRELEDFDVLYSWTAMWRGPISFLMTTTAAPESEAHVALLKRIRALKTHFSLPELSFHLLHLTHQDQGSPNIFLNFARLFSATKTVMLVPEDILFLPWITSDVAEQELRSGSFPFIVTTSAANWSTFSTLPALSPLIIQLDHPVWCTDRFFVDNTRLFDWTECLWQFWLDAFGEFGDIQAAFSMSSQQAYNSEASSEGMIRQRLSARFRTETCEVVARTMATLGPKGYKGWKRKLIWLKQTCGQLSVERMFRNAYSGDN